MRFLIIITLLFFSNHLFSQDSCTFYFDKHNIASTVDSFDFFRVVKIDNFKKHKVHVKEYDRNGSIKLEGEYAKTKTNKMTDLSVFAIYSVDENYQKDGVFKRWDKNGKNISEIQFKKGKRKKIIFTEKEFVIVEKSASFKGGGIDSARSYITHNLKYPSEAIKNNLQGKVYVQFCIDTVGDVIDVKVIKNVHPLLDKASVQVIESMPKWEPGQCQGKPVKQQFVVPIIFK